jgi:peptide/nickel transport system substrate-binding protein
MEIHMSHLARGSRLAALALAGTLALTACGGSSTDGDGDSPSELSKTDIFTTGFVGQSDAGDPQDGGTLTVAEYGEIRTLNPAQAYASGTVGGSALAAVYDTLMRYDYESRTWEPKLAESLTSDDDVTWTLKLREDITFADGSAYDADAVIGSIEYYTSLYGYQSTTMLANGTKMKKVDDLTVEFTSAGPWATFPAMLSGGPGMIMAPAAYKDAAQDPTKFQPIGAGAFELDHYTPSEELVLNARPDYWDGAPHLEKLRFVWIQGDEPKVESMKSGEVDAAFLRAPQTVENARRDGLGGMMFVVGAGSQIAINAREGRPGADLRVRQALQLAFDNDAYAERAWEGAGMPSKALFAETSPWYTGVEYPDVDRDKATELLDEAKADGYDGKISYLFNADPASQASAVQLEAQLEAVGFEVELDAVDNIADITKRLYIDHDFDLGISAANAGDPDPYASLFEVLSTRGSTNVSGYMNPEIDTLLEELRAHGDDPEAAMGAMSGIEEIIRDEVPVINIAPSGNFVTWADTVHGIVPTVQEMVHYDKAWVEQ